MYPLSRKRISMGGRDRYHVISYDVITYILLDEIYDS